MSNIINIENAPVFHKMVVSAWIRRTLDHVSGAKYVNHVGNSYRLQPPTINPEKHLGKASIIYKRFKNIIDKYWSN